LCTRGSSSASAKDDAALSYTAIGNASGYCVGRIRQGSTMERISGPFNGFYIATYAGESGGPTPSFFAYAKICRGKPENYWDAHCCAKIPGEQLHPTAHAAISEAERRAREQTSRFAPFAFAQPRRSEHYG
jgi:hypothetical protein